MTQRHPVHLRRMALRLVEVDAHPEGPGVPEIASMELQIGHLVLEVASSSRGLLLAARGHDADDLLQTVSERKRPQQDNLEPLRINLETASIVVFLRPCE